MDTCSTRVLPSPFNIISCIIQQQWSKKKTSSHNKNSKWNTSRVIVRGEMHDDVRFGDSKKNIYRLGMCVDIFIYIYLYDSEYVPIKTERKTLQGPPPTVYCRRIVKNPAEFSRSLTLCPSSLIIILFLSTPHPTHSKLIRLLPSVAVAKSVVVATFILRTCSAYREQWSRQPPGSNSWSTWDVLRTSIRASAIGRCKLQSVGFESKSSAGLLKNVVING